METERREDCGREIGKKRREIEEETQRDSGKRVCFRYAVTS